MLFAIGDHPKLSASESVDVHGPTGEGRPFAIFDHFSDPVVITDVGFHNTGPSILYVNESFASASGLRPADLVHQPLATVYPEFGRPQHPTTRTDPAAGGQPGRWLGSLRRRDGSATRVCWTAASMAGDPAPDCLVWRIAPSPIPPPGTTDTGHATRALRDSEQRLRDFAEIAADWFWESDEQLVITYVSDVHRQLTGIADERVLGQRRDHLFRDGLYRSPDAALHLGSLQRHWDTTIEYTVRRDDDHEVVIHDRATPYFDQRGQFCGYRGVGHDITEQRRLTRHVAWQATHDSLTGALNRSEFERRLEKTLAQVRRDGGRHVLCFVDLDRFKLLNDTLGHAAGDQLLKLIVDRIRNEISAEDLLGRIGGDEFGLILRDTGMARAAALMRRLGAALRGHEFTWEDRRFSIAMSIGLAPLDQHTGSGSAVMARADAACYRAKAADSDGVWVSDAAEAARLRTYSGILRALASGPVDLADNFQLVGQPILALGGDQPPLWYEVLLRLVGRDGRYYRPFEFLRLAEQSGKMATIDAWVLENAVAQLAGLIHREPRTMVSINLSRVPGRSDQWSRFLSNLLEQQRLDPRNLCFEIGERVAMNDLDGTTALVRSLAGQGFRVALDDFGSGAASLSCLRRLPVQYIKLSGELIRALRPEATDIAIIESIDRLARRLDIATVAVQVESPAALAALRQTGVALGQGEVLAGTRPLQALVDGGGGTRQAIGRS